MEKYSNVDSIKLELEFVDPDGMTKPSYKTWKLNQNHLLETCKFDPDLGSGIRITCPYISCIKGGFNITDEVDQAIKENKNSIKISSSCQGWQDSRRINKNRCLCQMTCDVEITYKK